MKVSLKISKNKIDQIISEEYKKIQIEDLKKEIDLVEQQMRGLYPENDLDEETIKLINLEEVFKKK